MNHGSLFSGIGGFDLAAEWMGWENEFHCEINPFGQKILKYYWPNAKSYADIKQTDFSIHRGTIDVLTGGFPCQPYSQAGKRKGKEDERHLWPEMLRAIREIRPRWVVGENVSGLINWKGGMALNEIKADLEGEGFEMFPPVIIPACAKDAPHRRDRLWIIANTHSNGFNRSNGEHEVNTSEERLNALNDVEHVCDVAYSQKQRFQKWNAEQVQNGTHTTVERYNGISGWEDFPTQPPVCGKYDGLSRELAGITFSRHRTESIKAYGNAIVPQIAYEIFKAIQLFTF